VSEKFEQSLRKMNAPCKIVFTIKKLKTFLPSLKASVEKSFKSGVVYKICGVVHDVICAMSVRRANI